MPTWTPASSPTSARSSRGRCKGLRRQGQTAAAVDAARMGAAGGIRLFRRLTVGGDLAQRVPDGRAGRLHPGAPSLGGDGHIEAAAAAPLAAAERSRGAVAVLGAGVVVGRVPERGQDVV